MIKVHTPLNNTQIELKSWKFPDGALGYRIENPEDVPGLVSISAVCQSSDDIISILLINDAIKRINPNARVILSLSYVPYSRQDRVCSPGEPFSLQVIVDILKTGNFHLISSCDVHSDVFTTLWPQVDNHSQAELFLLATDYYDLSAEALIAPDKGALKKIYDVANCCDSIPVIVAEKHRDPETGNITHTSIPLEEVNKYKKLLVVDDICDGGRTFVELGKVIRDAGYTGELKLYVTHGIFSKGKEELLQYYDTVNAFTDWSQE